MTVSTSEVNQSREKIIYYYNSLSEHFLDRSEVLKLMITAATAQEPLLFVGRPGTAKSLLVSAFCQGLGIDDNEYFEYMLTKFTEPSEVMGPVDLNSMKEGKFIRKTTGHLPEAKVAFLDEIFKANSAILNMLLTIINERKYYQEGLPKKVPLVTLFAASNEIPDFSEFDALKDRFILKVETTPVKDKYFSELIRAGINFEVAKNDNSVPWKTDCTLTDFTNVHDYILKHVLPEAVKADNNKILFSEKMTTAFRAAIATLEGEDLKIEITDRKLIKLYKLILTEAFLFNGGEVTVENLKLLKYCANNFKDIRKIKNRLDLYLEHLA